MEKEQHSSALKMLLLESSPTLIHITADETSDGRDHNILYATFSRAILKAVAEVELPYEKIQGVVKDSTAYCKKTY